MKITKFQKTLLIYLILFIIVFIIGFCFGFQLSKKTLNDIKTSVFEVQSNIQKKTQIQAEKEIVVKEDINNRKRKVNDNTEIKKQLEESKTRDSILNEKLNKILKEIIKIEK